MTDSEQLATLEILNASLLALREINALPEIDEMAMHRAIVAAKAANDACNSLAAHLETQAIIERVKT